MLRWSKILKKEVFLKGDQFHKVNIIALKDTELISIKKKNLQQVYEIFSMSYIKKRKDILDNFP